MKVVATAVLVGLGSLAYQQMGGRPEMNEQAATTYEHLATAIIEIRATETNLVQGILSHHYMTAKRLLQTAAKADPGEQAGKIEAAATEIGYIANEGDKSVQAIRQRLLKAGHHHHTDAETKDDYIFVDGKEKKQFVQLANRVAKLAPNASSSELREAGTELTNLFEKATAPE